MKRPIQTGLRRQPTSWELQDTILGFICRYFYQGNIAVMVKDRTRLLRWVVLKPAAWLDERGVTGRIKTSHRGSKMVGSKPATRNGVVYG